MPSVLSLVGAYFDLGNQDYTTRKTVVGATQDALGELTRSTYDALIIPSATRRLRHLGTSLENTSLFLHMLSNEGRLPRVVIVVLESDEHAGQLLAHQVNGCIMQELRREDVDITTNLLGEWILYLIS